MSHFLLIHRAFMMHTSSFKHSPVARLMTNSMVSFKKLMDLNRFDRDFSPVESVILYGLGVGFYVFKPLAPREKIIPKQVQRHQQLIEVEKQRLLGMKK